MSTYIKTGYWEKLSRGFKGYLNLDQLIESIISTSPTPTKQYDVYTDPLTSIKLRQGFRNSNWVVDKTITNLGFDGVENVDWEQIGGQMA